MDCRKFLDSNALGLTVAALSSYDPQMRAAAYCVLAAYYSHLEGARFREQSQVSRNWRALEIRVWLGGAGSHPGQESLLQSKGVLLRPSPSQWEAALQPQGPWSVAKGALEHCLLVTRQWLPSVDRVVGLNSVVKEAVIHTV